MAAGTVPASGTIWRRELEDEGAIPAIAADVAALIGPGDLVTLSGGLGTGRTALARASHSYPNGRARPRGAKPGLHLDAGLRGPNFAIVHADFYRIEKPRELMEVGFEEACDGALALVEWPEHAGGFLDVGRLDIELRLDKDRGPRSAP